MMKSILTKLLTLLSGCAMLSAITTVNSACYLWLYEEKAPEEAYKLIK